ncbi:MAG: HipA domain-containing protein [Bacteroidales bacterium]|jgi:serine/threonine-protein kinase HipA
MKKEQHRKIFVYAHWKGMKNPALMGVLHATHYRNNEIFSFEYTKEWLNSGFSQFLDPDLQLYSGQQYAKEGKQNFGVFLDSSPDRWGRLLMKRREALLAKEEKRNANNLFESDFLLGVFDEYRMGALRFKLDEASPFLDNNERLASPPWTSLKKLEYASMQLEKDGAIYDPNYKKWLEMLIAPGSSLGGARPKSAVLDDKNNLWIAKFPSRNDTKDVGMWEMIIHELALKAEITVPEIKTMKFTGKYHTYLTKRFDRTIRGERIHFASALTMLGYNDGTNASDGVSYLELAKFIIQHGANVDNDLEELWKRIVFNISVSNTDDHLRNHGFILTEKGWILSPAFDINPNESGTGLSLNISENDNSLDLNLALEVAEFFRVNKKRAEEIILIVKKSVDNWHTLAKKMKISKEEQEQMASAFVK